MTTHQHHDGPSVGVDPGRVLSVCLALLLLGVGAVSCKKKIDTEPQLEPPDTATAVSETFVEPEFDPGDVLSKDLQTITEQYLRRIHFDFDKSDIRADAEPLLEENGAFLRKYPTVMIVIEGHCDERGSIEYNLALGERRAKATKQWLANLGVDPSRMSTISYGKEVPLDPGHGEAAWASNRRAQLVAVAK